MASRPISLTLAALGGQGGGVVSGWLTEVAKHEGHLVQATSVPGVAQRTGATIYYLEFFPEAALPKDGRRPVMALMPSPGDVDIVVASELIEAGRMILRGLVTPDRTTLIASTHRSYSIGEKSHRGEGRADGERILQQSREQSRRFVSFDMAEVASRNNAVISAVLLGAIAGASGLPFQLESYRRAIRDGGIAVDRNLAAFDASVKSAREAADGSSNKTVAPATPSVERIPEALRKRIESELPPAAQSNATHGVARLIDYQDAAYAKQYLDSLQRIAALEPDAAGAGKLTAEVARGLALWMSFEDTIRVADLKTRSDRKRRVLAATMARPGQLVHVVEFMSPRVEEICGTLPAGMGRAMRASRRWSSLISRVCGGRQLRTSTVSGYLLLRSLSGLRRWRRGTLRFTEEHARIARWLDQVAAMARKNYDVALELAALQHLVRGYGDTFERGLHAFERLSQTATQLADRPDGAQELKRLHALEMVGI